MPSIPQRRAVIIDGVRTPFAKANTNFRNMTALDLAKRCVGELIQRVAMPVTAVDTVIYGQVIPSLEAPNIAREVVIGTHLSTKTDAYTVNRACATGYQTIINAIQHIESGAADCVVAGGADSASQVPVTVSRHLVEVLQTIAKASPTERLQALTQISLADLKPRVPQVRERSTKETMGESAEKMAKDNDIPRVDQDDYAHRSHQLAAQAWREGRFDDEVMTVYPPPNYEDFVKCDQTVRFDSERAKYNDLPPVFDKQYGSISAGNSSPLSDGASAVLLMEERKAKELGIEPLGRVVGYDFAAVDPFDQLLIGPVFAVPRALRMAHATWDTMDLIDMHEAFAAQILSVLKVLKQHDYARERFNLDIDEMGEIDIDRFNVNGGSIALGHPFAATGGRQIIQTLRELQRRSKTRALCSACAAGGLSAAVVLECA